MIHCFDNQFLGVINYILKFIIGCRFIAKFARRIRRQSTLSQEKMADITSLLQETISGIRVVKAFAMEKFEIDKFTRKVSEHYITMLRVTRLS